MTACPDVFAICDISVSHNVWLFLQLFLQTANVQKLTAYTSRNQNMYVAAYMMEVFVH
jgi:hypothetical protein